MTRQVDAETLAPLLTVTRGEADAHIRLAALDAASRFALSTDAWHDCASMLHRLILDEPEGSETRRRALKLAIRFPLMSIRQFLRDLAADPSSPDREVVQAGLAHAGDPSQIPDLLEQAEAGSEEAYRLLAATPLEDEYYTVHDIPVVPPGVSADLRLWRALLLARLGDYSELDAFFETPHEQPPILRGKPSVVYDTVAAIRPVPADMREHLLQQLKKYEGMQQAHVVRLIVWAATGIADAAGKQQEIAKEEPPKPVTGGTLRAPCYPRDDGERIIHSVRAGNQEARSLPADASAPTIIGRAIIDNLPDKIDTRTWPVAELALEQLQAERPALDKGQFARLIAHGEPSHVIKEIAGLLPPDRPVADRLHLLKMLADAASYQAGRSGIEISSGRGLLIDDLPKASMMPCHEEPPAMSAVAEEPALDLEKDFIELNGVDVECEAEPVGVEADLGILPATDDEGLTAKASDTAVPPAEENRRVHTTVLHDGKRRHTFLAGADNVIRCWIGLPEPDVAAVADTSIPGVALPPEGLPLTVELSWNGRFDRQELLLPADRTASTGKCDLHLQVPEGEQEICAAIAFRYRGRMFEIVHVKGMVLQPGQAEEPWHEITVEVQASLREVIALTERTPVDSCAVMQTSTPTSADQEPTVELWVFGGNGAHRCDLQGTEAAMKTLNQDLFTTQKSLVRKKAAATNSGSEDRLDSEHEDVLRLLRIMARHGSAIHKQLKSTICKDPGERIQLLNMDPAGYIPLEFVYDRGYPADDAMLCDGWYAALQSDLPQCPTCSQQQVSARDLRWMPTICPLGFWSLQKIIERRDPRLAVTDDGGVHPSVPTNQRQQLPIIDDTVFASSHLVSSEDRQATWQALQHQFEHPVLADDWDQWLDALEARDRPLLVILPHHGAEEGLDYLEIGDENLPPRKGHLSRGQLDELYTNPRQVDPGPIVLLLGCQTGTSTEEGYVQLARRFQELKSSIVVGTMAKVLGRHAAPVAGEFVKQLLAVEDATIDFGTIMRRVRRRMMANGYLMALCLVALGDAEWRLTPRQKAAQPPTLNP